MASWSERTPEGRCPPHPGLPTGRVGPARRAAGADGPDRAGRMEAEARYPGLVAREVPALSTFTPESAAALPGLPWLQQRRVAAAATFSSSRLPSEKDEVWRYSRIDQLDLDRYQPAGLLPLTPQNDPGPSPSDRVHSLVASLGPRSGLVVTINGVLATLSSSVGDDVLSLGRAVEHPEGEALLGSVVTAPGDFLLLNEAFAVDPLIVDIAAGAVIEDPVVVVHVVTGTEGQAVFPRTLIRAGAASRAGVIEMVIDADTPLLADLPTPVPPTGASDRGGIGQLVVPLTEIEVADDATLAFVSLQSLGGDTWELAHAGSTIGAKTTLHPFAVAGAGTAPFVCGGLIRGRRGAVPADAMQNNDNLVLDQGAHADPVPNLDIEE